MASPKAGCAWKRGSGPRATMSVSIPPASPAASDEATNRPNPASRSLRLPRMSAARPPKDKEPLEEQPVRDRDPLQVRLRNREVSLGGGERHVRDRHVEHDHELRRRHREYQTLVNRPLPRGRVDARRHVRSPSESKTWGPPAVGWHDADDAAFSSAAGTC